MTSNFIQYDQEQQHLLPKNVADWVEEDSLERDVAFRYLAANQHPDFRTISLFRKNHREEFEHLFVEILHLCQEAGMAEMGEVALDGRRAQGDAALDQNRTREQITEEIYDILDEAAEIDEAEDEEYGPEQRGEELREQEGRLNRLREAKARLDAKEQQRKEEQAEKIRQREQEEEEVGRKKRGRKPTPPEEVVLPEDTKANR